MLAAENTKLSLRQQIGKATGKVVTLDFLVNDLRVPLQDMSQQLGYTTRHVARLIRRKYGMNLREILQKRMLSSAKELLLRQPLHSIKTVATMSGFSGTHAMYNCFEKFGDDSCGIQKRMWYGLIHLQLVKYTIRGRNVLLQGGCLNGVSRYTVGSQLNYSDMAPVQIHRGHIVFLKKKCAQDSVIFYDYLTLALNCDIMVYEQVHINAQVY